MTRASGVFAALSSILGVPPVGSIEEAHLHCYRGIDRDVATHVRNELIEVILVRVKDVRHHDRHHHVVLDHAL